MTPRDSVNLIPSTLVYNRPLLMDDIALLVSGNEFAKINLLSMLINSREIKTRVAKER